MVALISKSVSLKFATSSLTESQPSQLFCVTQVFAPVDTYTLMEVALNPICINQRPLTAVAVKYEEHHRSEILRH